MSKRAPKRTCSAPLPPMMKFGSVRTGPRRKTAGIELMNVIRYRMPATSAVLRMKSVDSPFVAVVRALLVMSEFLSLMDELVGRVSPATPDGLVSRGW